MISVGGVVERSGTVVTASAPTTLTVSNNSGLIITGPGTGSLAPGYHLPFLCRALVVASDDDPWPLVLDQRADPAGHLGRRDVACTSCAAWSYGTSACRSPGQHGTPDRLPDVIRTASNLVPFEIKDVRIADIVGFDQKADGGHAWLRPARSAASGWSRWRTRTRAFAACASGPPIETNV